MIKVCHMTSAHSAEDDRIFYKECVSLANNGFDTTLVECGDTYEKDNVHIVGVGEPPSSRIKRLLFFSKKVYKKALEIDADIYHFHDPELLPYGLKLKRKGKKVIFDSHENYTEQIKAKPYLSSWIRSFISGIYGLYERYVLKNIDAVIFPCTMQGKNPFEGQCKRTPIISNAAILGEFYNYYDPNIEKKDRQVCYVGGLTEHRGISLDIKACKLANVNFVLAGDFSPKEYKDEVLKMPEYSCVDYKGVLNRYDVMKLISESQIGLCTLLDYGQYLKIDTFGIKVFEYLSMGIPVILSNSSYNEKIVKEYGIGICINPESPEELAKAIRYILDNPKIAKEMGQNGRRMIKEKYNWGVEEKKLISLYNDIINEGV